MNNGMDNQQVIFSPTSRLPKAETEDLLDVSFIYGCVGERNNTNVDYMQLEKGTDRRVDLNLLKKYVFEDFINDLPEPRIWDGTSDISWYNEEDYEFIIRTAEELAGFFEMLSRQPYGLIFTLTKDGEEDLEFTFIFDETDSETFFQMINEYAVNGWYITTTMIPSKLTEDTFKNKIVKLGNHIRLNDTSNWKQWSESVVPANIWKSNSSFEGTFDGQGFTVSGVYMCHRDMEQQVGFFKHLINGATVKRLGIIESYISSNGINLGAITGNCVTVGEGESGQIIEDCYSNARVDGNSYFAGLCGSINPLATIKNSYYCGEVGFISSTTGVRGYINSYWTHIGAGPGTVDNCFVDYYKFGITVSNSQGTPKTTLEMKARATYTNWDFVNTWAIDPLVNDGYPYLKPRY